MASIFTDHLVLTLSNTATDKIVLHQLLFGSDVISTFWFVYFIGFIFVVAKYTPDLVLHLKKIHQSNLEDAEEQELREA